MLDYRFFTRQFNLSLRYAKFFFSLIAIVLIVHLWLQNQRLTEENAALRAKLNGLNLEGTKQIDQIWGDTLFEALSNSSSRPLKAAEVINGRPYSTEMDMPRFSMFTSEWLYMVEPGLGKRVVERLFGSRKEDYKEVVETGNKLLRRSSQTSGQVSFMFGLVRFLPLDGMHYELVYKEKRRNVDRADDVLIRKMSFLRPFGPLTLVKVAQPQMSVPSIFSTTFKYSDFHINFVLTATSDHMPQVLSFIDNHFISMGNSPSAASALNFSVTLVMFLDRGMTVDEVRKQINFKLMLLKFDLKVNIVSMADINPGASKSFSRGLGLHSGIQEIAKVEKNPLIFTTDVDVVVTPLFLNRCRLQAEKGRRVYFPLVFSLYNPKLVYPLFLNRSVPANTRDQLNIHDETGWWRDFGYGMGCFYKSDYDSVGGFGSSLLHLKGWGYEDVGLFRKFVASPSLLVVRATDPGIFHLYHKKHCDAGDIGNARYRSCIASRAYNEASHTQLGILCLKNGAELV